VILGVALVACSSVGPAVPTAAPTSTATLAAVVPTQPAAPTPSAAPSATVGTPSATPASAASPTLTTPVASKSLLTFQVIPDQSDARFTAREQLASRDLPSDAIGTTKQVSGKIVLDPSGAVVSDQSKVVVDLGSLQTDRPQRDNYIKRNTLQTDQFPTATFVPTEARGLPSPLPTSGTVKFQMAGNMTIHGTTKPMVWDVTAQVDGSNVTGQAITSFTLSDFGLAKPHVSIVLSIDDTIMLQVDLHLTGAS
jgi:polyisoprenoid-binding protein YceI